MLKRFIKMQIMLCAVYAFHTCHAEEPTSIGRNATVIEDLTRKTSARSNQVQDLQTPQYEIILPVDTLKGMSPSIWYTHMAINWWASPNVSVVFRVSLAPYMRNQPPPATNKFADYKRRLEEHKGSSGLTPDQPYYVMVASSDFYRSVCPKKNEVCQCNKGEIKGFMDNPKDIYMDPFTARELLKDPKVKGLYIHELMAFSNNAIPEDNKFNCPKPKYNDQGEVMPIYWDTLIAYADAAQKEKKQIIWNDAGDEGGWKLLVDLIERAPGTKKRDQDKAKELFENYGNVIVPLWANNRNTDDRNENDFCPAESTNGARLYCDKINNSIKAVQKLALKYTNRRFGASIQDWHTGDTFRDIKLGDQQFHQCLERDIINYTARAQAEKASVFEFESYWTREGFFNALLQFKYALLLQSKLSAGNWPRPMQCWKPK